MILAQLSLANSGNSPEALALAEKWLAGLLEAWQGISSGAGNQGRDSIPENCLPEME
jgi:flagellin-specific chaperone FliS